MRLSVIAVHVILGEVRVVDHTKEHTDIHTYIRAHVHIPLELWRRSRKEEAD